MRFQKYNKPVISPVSMSRSECIFTKRGQKYNSKIQVIHLSGFLCCTYPVHRPCPSTRWHIYTVRWSCCRKPHSDTGSAADSLLHKTRQGILGEKHTPSFHPSISCRTDHCFALHRGHSPSVQLGPVQPTVHPHRPVAGWQMPSLPQLQVWLHPSP